MKQETCMRCGTTKEIDFETEISINKKKKKIVLCEMCALPFIKMVGSHPPLTELLSYIGETKESFFTQKGEK